MTGANRRSASFRADIEGLRGIAVLLVVAFHCSVPGFSGGFIGVDVFFVLSGYLITGLLAGEVEASGKLNLVQFYARRVRRLLPASAVTVAVTLIIGALILAPQELDFTGRAGRATAVYMSNIFFAVNAADYFSPAVESNPFLHTWSLGVEEQFYLVWPLLIILGLQLLRSKRALSILLSILTAVSLVTSVWLTFVVQTFAFYELPTRAWEFGIGGLAALLPVGILKLSPRRWLIVGWAGVLCVVLAGCVISSANIFPGWVVLLPVLGTVAALVAGAELPGRGVGVLLAMPPLLALGTLSYSWYLWHWPLVVYAKAIFPTISVPGKVVAGLVSLGVAAITHRVIENPIRFHARLVKRPAVTLVLGVAVTAFSLFLSLTTIRFARHLAEKPEMKAIAAIYKDTSVTESLTKQCVTTGQSSEVKTCRFGDNTARLNIVLFGDSHALQWLIPLGDIAHEHGWRVTSVLKASCPAIDVPAGPPITESCESWRTNAIRQIIGMHPTAVFIASSTGYLGESNKPRNRFDVSIDEWQTGTKRTFQAFAPEVPIVIKMRDNPRLLVDVPTCLARRVRNSWYPASACVMDRSNVLSASVFEAEKAAARNLHNVEFIDFTDHYCNADICPTMQDGIVMYRDNNHLTQSFIDTLRPELETRLLAILNDPR